MFDSKVYALLRISRAGSQHSNGRPRLRLQTRYGRRAPGVVPLSTPAPSYQAAIEPYLTGRASRCPPRGLTGSRYTTWPWTLREELAPSGPSRGDAKPAPFDLSAIDDLGCPPTGPNPGAVDTVPVSPSRAWSGARGRGWASAPSVSRARRLAEMRPLATRAPCTSFAGPSVEICPTVMAREKAAAGAVERCAVVWSGGWGRARGAVSGW